MSFEEDDCKPPPRQLAGNMCAFLTTNILTRKCARILLCPVNEDGESLSPIMVEEIEADNLEAYKGTERLSIRTELVPNIYRSAFEYAEHAESDCRFFLECEWDENEEEGKSAPKNFRPLAFVVKLGKPKYASNERGLTTALMKHLENRERMLMSTIQGCMQLAASQSHSLRAENDAMRAREIENIRLREDLLDRRQERDAKTKKEEQQAEIVGSIAKGVAALLPPAVGKMVGLNASQALQGTPEFQGLRALIDGATPEELDQIAEWASRFPLRDPGRQAAFLTIIQNAIAKVETPEKKDESSNGKTEPATSWH